VNKNIQNERNGKRKLFDKRADDKVHPAALQVMNCALLSMEEP